ncbi:hypothetical protein E2P81_ATG00859 [Venturia nashicola]|uniref:HMG box domain-containing protein n=1 Tax=Venturia nashicola TaxID=86259 RepID=A0A4Z1PAE1_9PEZI|nr:hypothetical protein E6O75_ATG00875 [Venturia nashicola]TLD38316.1 hypothetical protein E2P81_ATG00859 [Venturia nashicola]
MAREPKAAPPHGYISLEEFIRTRDSVVTGLTTLTSGIHVLITAYINHSNQLLSGQGVEGFDTAEINKVFSTGGIPPLASAGAGATLVPLKKEKKKRVKKEKDPDAPKRPLTAFFLFSTNARDLVKRENPDSTPVEVNNEILRRWNQMDEPEKQRWKDLYAKNNEQYKKDVEAYKAIKGEDAVIEPIADEEDMEEELIVPEEEDEEEEEDVPPPVVAESTDSASDDSEAEPVREPTPPVVKKGKTAAKRKGAKENGQAALAAFTANSPSPSSQLHKEVPVPLPEEVPTSSKRKKATGIKEASPEEPKKKKLRKGTKQEETVEVAPPTVEKTKKKKRKSEGF